MKTALLAVCALASAACMTATQPAQAQSIFTQSVLTADVSGYTASLSTTVTASTATVVHSYKVCVRNSSNGYLDLPATRDVEIPTTGRVYSGAQIYPVGSYLYFACAQRTDGSWWNGATKAFSVPSQATAQTPTTMPVGNLPGWTQTLAQDFNTNSTIGSFQNTYASTWCGYAAGTSGVYYNDRVISSQNGLMDFNLDGKLGGAGSFGTPSTCWGAKYGRYSVRFKASGASGYGAAMMVWPSSNVWGDGEIDYPEGNLDGTFAVFQHPTNCSDCSAKDWFMTGAAFADWHIATTEWTSTGVKYFLDGSLIKSTTAYNPNTNHRWTVQVGPHSSTAQAGHLYIDWVSMYSPAA